MFSAIIGHLLSIVFRGENEFGEKMDLNNRGEAIVRIHVFVLMSNHFHF